MTMAGDITLGSHTTYWGQNLTNYVLNGTIPQTRVDDMGMVFIFLLSSTLTLKFLFSNPDHSLMVLPGSRHSRLPPGQLQCIQRPGRNNQLAY